MTSSARSGLRSPSPPSPSPRSRRSATARRIADKYKWNLADIYPTEAAWRAGQGQARGRHPALASFKGKLTASPAALADALERIYGARPRSWARLYSYASLLADQDTRDQRPPGHAAGDGAGRRRVQRRRVLRRSGDPQGRQGDHRQVPRRRAAPQAVPDAPRRRRPPRGPHAVRQRGEAAGRRRPDGRQRRRTSSASSSNADFPYPTVTLSRRQVGAGSTPAGYARAARAAQPRRSREGDVRLLQQPRRLQPHVRHHDERRGAEGALLREGAEATPRRSRASSTARTFRCRSTRAWSTASTATCRRSTAT